MIQWKNTNIERTDQQIKQAVHLGLASKIIWH